MVKARYIERASDETKAKYGDGDVWPPAAAWDLGEILPNGNYVETDGMAVSHGVCGDTPQVSETLSKTRSSRAVAAAAVVCSTLN